MILSVVFCSQSLSHFLTSSLSYFLILSSNSFLTGAIYLPRSQSAHLFIDGAARFNLFLPLIPQLGFESTSVSRVAPTQDLLKDIIPTEVPHCSNMGTLNCTFTSIINLQLQASWRLCVFLPHHLSLELASSQAPWLKLRNTELSLQYHQMGKPWNGSI